MSEQRPEEILIVGGGLAGASAACVLAEAGCPVLLLERDPRPRNKVCGEFLSAEAQIYLSRLGVDLDLLGASRISRLRLFHRGGQTEADLPFMARGLSRKALDEALLQRAITLGAQVARGVTVRSISTDGPCHRVDAGPLGTIHAKSLFLASGKHDVRGVKRPASGAMNDLIGFKMHYRLTKEQHAALDGAIEITLFEEGYAGLQPIEGGIANLCLVVTRQRFESIGRGWDSLTEQIARDGPPLADRLRGATMLFERPLSIFQIPYGFVHHPDPTEPQGIFRLGDQIGVIPSFTGEGMSMALHSGCLAAGAYLRHGRASTVFHEQMAADIRRQIRLAFLLNKAARQPLGQAAIFTLCRIWPVIMRQVASFTRMREASMQRALARP